MSEPNLRLSIIIPMYNTEKYISRCINSCYKQGLSEAEFEVIVIDDGSTDNSYAVVDNIKKTHSNLYLYHQENMGLAGARNTGIKHSFGEYLEFIDSDDYLVPNSIGRIITLAIKTKVDVLAFLMKVLDKNGNEQFSKIQPFPLKTILSSGDILVKNLNIGSVCNNLYRKDFIKKNELKFHVGITHEDVAFNSCVYSCVNKIMFTDYCPYVYYWNPESLNRSTDISKIRKATIDDLFVITSVMQFLKERRASKKLMTFFRKRGNSLIVSSILNFIKNRSLPRDIKIEFIDTAKEIGLYPIYGITQSVKTTLLIPLINKEKLIRIIL